MPAPLHRCLAVGGTAAGASVALVAWLLPAALAPAPGLDGALVRICAVVAAAAATWLGVVGVAVSVEAAAGGGTRFVGVPGPVRRALLAACGVAMVAGLAAPAGAAPGRHDGPQKAAAVVASAIAGLPLPDRPHGGAQVRRGGSAPARAVTVQPGDSLWELAEEHLGDGNRWTELYAANRSVVGADPDLIRPAERLRIPAPAKETR